MLPPQSEDQSPWIDDPPSNRGFNLAWLLALASLFVLGAIAAFAGSFDVPSDLVWLYWIGVFAVVAAWGLVWRTWWGRKVAIAACGVAIVGPPLLLLTDVIPHGGWGGVLIAVYAAIIWVPVAIFCGVTIWRLRWPEMRELFRPRPVNRRLRRTILTGMFAVVVLLIGLLLHSERLRDAISHPVDTIAENYVRRQMQPGVDEFIVAVREHDTTAREQAVQKIDAAGKPLSRPIRVLPLLVKEQLATLDPTRDAEVRRALVQLMIEKCRTESRKPLTELCYELLADSDVEIRLLAAPFIKNPCPGPNCHELRMVVAALAKEENPEIRLHLTRAIADSAEVWGKRKQYQAEIEAPLRRALKDESEEVRAEAIRGLKVIHPKEVFDESSSP